jgi:hypothetical protein
VSFTSHCSLLVFRRGAISIQVLGFMVRIAASLY